jgi:hypothetical protein
VSEYRTATGRLIGAAEVEAAARQAERGYEPEQLDSLPRKRGRRPTVGEAAAAVVPIRLDQARVDAIDARAAQLGTTRSDFIRDAIDRRLAAA